MAPWFFGYLGAAGGGYEAAFDLLETTTLTSTTSSVTFSGLGAYSDYKHLQIRMLARSNRGSADLDMRCRINGDTGSNYTWHGIRGLTGSALGQNGTSNTSYHLGKFPGNTGDGDVFGAFVSDILDFSSSNKATTIKTVGGVANNNFMQNSFYTGLYNSTSAVTSIQFFGEADSFLAGSTFSLYGVRG
jgi:hypothetical protein